MAWEVYHKCVVAGLPQSENQATRKYINFTNKNSARFRKHWLVILNDVTLLTNSLTQACWCSWWRHQMETFSALLAIVHGIHRSPVNSPHRGQWRGASMFSLICAWINGWVNNREAGDLRRHRAHYEVTLMYIFVINVCVLGVKPFRQKCSWCTVSI